MTGSLAVFSDPRSVAVVGASADPAKWGYWLARGALRGRTRREVYLVNRGSAVIEGVRSFPALTDLPEAPELVVLCAPAATVPTVVDEALELGARGFLGITAGIDVAHGDPGLERRLVERITAAGARIVGPNCLGLYDAAAEIELAWGKFEPGQLGIISQSGQLGLEIAGLAAHAGLGVSRFVSVGNQVDVTARELLEDLVDHAATKAVVLYLESFAEGRKLVMTMAKLAAAGKPVVVLTVGASEASQAAARSHTGALTSATDVVAAACAAAGAVLVETPAQAVDVAHLLLGSPMPRGPRVAVVSDSGGQGALAADALVRAGLAVPRLSPRTAHALAELLPTAEAVSNPLDLAGAGEQDLATYGRVVESLLGSDEVDTVVLSGYFGTYGLETPELADREMDVVDTLADAVRSHARPVVVHSLSHDSPAVRSMRAKAVPTLHTIDGVARSLALAVQLSKDRPADGADGDVMPSDATVGTAIGYLAARDLITRYGVRYPNGRAIGSIADLHAATVDLQPPYVLKAAWLEHKTELGGVVMDLPDQSAAEAAFVELVRRLGRGTYVVEEMETGSDVVELIVGARRDPSFGPVVMVGIGGVHAELYRDTQVALAPVTEPDALRMIRSLRAYPLLRGWRGRPAVDVAAAAAVVTGVSRLLAEQPGVAECEVNPLRVGPDGAVAVDALVLAADGGRWLAKPDYPDSAEGR